MCILRSSTCLHLSTSIYAEVALLHSAGLIVIALRGAKFAKCKQWHDLTIELWELSFWMIWRTYSPYPFVVCVCTSTLHPCIWILNCSSLIWCVVGFSKFVVFHAIVVPHTTSWCVLHYVMLLNSHFSQALWFRKGKVPLKKWLHTRSRFLSPNILYGRKIQRQKVGTFLWS